MDLSFSGVPDDALSLALRRCKLPYIALPITGKPFSIKNFYTELPLFSDAVRTAFDEHYHLVETKNHYRVYACNYGNASGLP
jgi:hypothetical protein